MDDILFQNALEEFIRSGEFKGLGIGEFVTFEMLTRIERPPSSQIVCVLKGTKGTQKIYIKIYKNIYNYSEKRFIEKISTDFKTNLFWYKNFSQSKGFSTFKPLYLSAKNKVIITEAVNGENLAYLIARGVKYWSPLKLKKLLKDRMYKVGNLLKTFQDFYGLSGSCDYNALIEDIDIRLKILVKNPRSHFTEKERQKVLNFFYRNLSLIQHENLQLVYLHSDFAPSNILVNKDKLVLHDFSQLKIGHPYFDFTRFYHQLELYKYKHFHSSNYIRKLQDTFLEGYGYQKGTENIEFKFFLLRNYFTHYKGIAKNTNEPFISRMYNQWVILNHKKRIFQIIKNL